MSQFSPFPCYCIHLIFIDSCFISALYNSITSLYSIMKFPDECRDNMTRLHTEVIMWSKHIAWHNRRKQTAILLIVSSICDINQSLGVTVSKVGWMWWTQVDLRTHKIMHIVLKGSSDGNTQHYSWTQQGTCLPPFHLRMIIQSVQNTR